MSESNFNETAMTNQDEQAIRDVVSTWLRASREGDTQTVLDLIADDAVFLTPGHPPFGKKVFESSQGDLANFTIDGEGTVREVKVLGDWAFAWTDLRVVMTPKAGGQSTRRSGNTLSIFRRLADGRWVLARDANMLALES